MRQYAAHERIAAAGAVPYPFGLPLGQIRQRAGAPPERHAPRFLALGRLAPEPNVRPSTVHVNVVEPKCADFGDTQSATASQSNDDLVALRIQ